MNTEHQVGVVIGRWQVETLHEGHRFLINEAFRHHKKVIIFIGCAPIQGTKHNPLDYPTRERLLRSEYPDATILPLYDHLSNEEWSKQLDSQIRGIYPNVTNAKLYGGRSSFQEHYCGTFEPVNINSDIEYKSGTKQREDIGKVVRGSADFRAGIVYSTQNSWPYVKMCVDIAYVKTLGEIDGSGGSIGNKVLGKLRDPLILLGRKETENKWRVPGGMVEKGESLEFAACKELGEETDMFVEMSKLKYIGSYPVGDWRFKNAGEIGLLTALFLVEHQFGAPVAKDDLVEVKWCPLSKAEREVTKGHKVLIAAVKKHLKVGE